MVPITYKCLGIGDPCTDVIARSLQTVLDRFCDEPGGSTLVNGSQLEQILRMLKDAAPGSPRSKPELSQVAGGSAANAMVCTSRLVPTLSSQYDLPATRLSYISVLSELNFNGGPSRPVPVY